MKGPPSSPNSPIVSVISTDEDVIVKVASLLGVRYYSVKPREPHHKAAFSCRRKGSVAMELMKNMLPFMSIRRQKQINEALESYREGARDRWIRTRLKPIDFNEARSLLASGKSYRKVAKLYNINHETLRNRILKGF